MEVFLGGTTAKGTNWREKLIPILEIDYFNPVVDDWDEKAYKKELQKRKTCDIILYILSPLMEGGYSIAEVTDDSNKRPEKTILCILEKDGEGEYSKKRWTKSQEKSNEAIKKLVEKNGAFVLDDLEEVAEIINSFNE